MMLSTFTIPVTTMGYTTLSALRSEAEKVSDRAWKNDSAPVSFRYTTPSLISSGLSPIKCNRASAFT